MAKEPKAKDQETGYEQVIARLEGVVTRLEKGDLPLEDSLRAFEEGIALVRQGEARLTEAEKRIEQLLATPGGDKVVPFEPEAARPEPTREPRRNRKPDSALPGDDVDGDIPF